MSAPDCKIQIAGMQIPELHSQPVTQPLPPSQLVGQAVWIPSQRYGAQVLSFGVPAGETSQVPVSVPFEQFPQGPQAVLQQKRPTQKPLQHWLFSLQPVPSACWGAQ